jgi:hypothetical protein
VSTIDALFASLAEPAAPVVASVEPAPLQQASVAAFPDLSLPFPRISPEALANIDSWLWLVFASVIFLIVTVIAALYMQIAERNLRNLLIARDYEDRRRQYAQLHLLELAARRPDETQ